MHRKLTDSIQLCKLLNFLRNSGQRYTFRPGSWLITYRWQLDSSIIMLLSTSAVHVATFYSVYLLFTCVSQHHARGLKLQGTPFSYLNISDIWTPLAPPCSDITCKWLPAVGNVRKLHILIQFNERSLCWIWLVTMCSTCKNSSCFWSFLYLM